MSLPEQELLELFQKYLQNTLTEEEGRLLNELASQNKEVEEMLLVLGTPSSVKNTIEAEIIYEKTRPNSLEPNSTGKSLSKHIIFYWKKVSIVAAAILLVCGFCIYYYSNNQKMNVENWHIVHTERGERKFLKLVDGTEVWLNNESKLKVKRGYGTLHRDITLIGEAYFSVKRNEKIPLHVYTNNTIIEVLGTVFNVRSYPDENNTETTLIEGKVKLRLNDDKEKEYFMIPGDRVLVSKNASETVNTEKLVSSDVVDLQINYKKKDEKSMIDLKWIDNKLVLNADPLHIVAVKLSRWFNKVVILETESQSDKQFSGVFEEQECEDVLKLLKRAGGDINYKVNKDTIYIK